MSSRLHRNILWGNLSKCFVYVKWSFWKGLGFKEAAFNYTAIRLHILWLDSVYCIQCCRCFLPNIRWGFVDEVLNLFLEFCLMALKDDDRLYSIIVREGVAVKALWICFKCTLLMNSTVPRSDLCSLFLFYVISFTEVIRDLIREEC